MEDTVKRDVLVPTYFDPRFDLAFATTRTRLAADETTVGKMLSDGWIDIAGGHGSPSNDQRIGTVPYVKVSDIRSLRINVNPTNMIPRALARKLWGGESSGLEAWDLITPNRASSNIGEFAILLPGEEQIVLTKEIFRIRVTEEGAERIDPFYLLWALSLKSVRDQWKRIALMQTNREDVGNRHREVRLPLPPSLDWAKDKSRAFRLYFEGIATAKGSFLDAIRAGDDQYIGSIYTEQPVDAAEGAAEAEGEAEGVIKAILEHPETQRELVTEVVARAHRRA